MHTSLWRMGIWKLPCGVLPCYHDCPSRYAASGNIQGLTLPDICWVLSRRMLIPYPFWLIWCSLRLRVQWRSAWYMPNFAPINGMIIHWWSAKPTIFPKQIAQVARHLTTDWMAQVQFLVLEVSRFFFIPSYPDWSRGPLSFLQNEYQGAFPQGQRWPSVRLATLPLPSAVAVYMWTLASMSPVDFHGPVMQKTLL